MWAEMIRSNSSSLNLLKPRSRLASPRRVAPMVLVPMAKTRNSARASGARAALATAWTSSSRYAIYHNRYTRNDLLPF